MKKVLNKYNLSFILKLVVILLSFCVFNRVKAIDYVDYTSESWLKWIMENEDLTDGYYNLTADGVTYPIHLYVLEGDQDWSTNQTFGDSGDVGTSSTNALHTVVVYVKGNVTIEEGVTVTAYGTAYGGPKGMFLYVSGNLINKGTLSMTARGGKAAGQKVNLWKNEDGSYEFVPAAGGNGGASKSVSGTGTTMAGNAGAASTVARGTGGGGTGAGRSYGCKATVGKGGNGTSYSGGAGSGASNNDGAGCSASTSGAGSSAGGAGSNGVVKSSNSSGYGQISMGGTGNSSGSNATYRESVKNLVTRRGTGGLLVVFANNIINSGSITAQGVSSSTASRSNTNGRVDTGGASGGGSINLFYGGNYSNTGTVSAAGGAKINGEGGQGGGAGGAGKVTATQLILDEEFLNPTLSSLTIDKGVLTPKFDSNTKEYAVTLDTEDSVVNVNATLTNEENYITSGLGAIDIPSGIFEHNVVLTSKIGIVETYKIVFYRQPSSYKYLSGITVDGNEISNFNPTTLSYNTTVSYDSDEVDLDVLLGRPSQSVVGTGKVSLKSGNNLVTIIVTSEDGNYFTTYSVNIFREHSTKLKDLVIGDYVYSPEFDPETLEYYVTIMGSVLSLNVDATPYDEEATVSLSGFGYIKTSGTGKITVSEPNSNNTVYTVRITKEGIPEQTNYTYGYTGSYQTFVAPAIGFYKIELWGAQGGNSRGNNSKKCSYSRGNAYGGGCGGFGAYTSGTIKLNKDDTLYIYVGQRGLDASAKNNRAGGWNGGGSSTHDHSDDEASGSGGGATDVRLVSGAWNNFVSLKSRIMVAAGGGGGSDVYAGGSGGKTTSSTARYSRGATQKTGYAFGYGENAVYRKSNIDVAGGGSGYFGGYSTATNSSNYTNYGQVGTGGSSFVSGCSGCVAISDESTSQSNLKFLDSNVHYSGIEFSDISMIAGGSSMPTKTTGYAVGNVSNGYAKITLLPQPSENNYLTNISLKGIEYKTNEIKTVENFAASGTEGNEVLLDEDYYVNVSTTETSATISARPADSLSTIEGLGTYDVESGETIIPITITAESGDTRIYRVHINREEDDNQYPYDITISGLVPSLCSSNEAFCQLNPALFSINNQTYTLTVPSRIKQLWFNVDKGHQYQTVSGDGKVTLNGGENMFTVTVTSEDGQNHSVYNYIITRDMTGNTDLSYLDIVEPQRDINYDPDMTEYYISIPNEYETWEDITNDPLLEFDENNKAKKIQRYKEETNEGITTQVEIDVLQLYIKPDDSNATYSISGPESLNVGMNQIAILVTAANGEIKTYIINVYREKNGNVFLNDLTVKDENNTYELTPEFNKINQGVYSVNVSNDVTNIEIIAYAEVSTTTVSGTGIKNLNTGNNAFNVITQSESGDIETYKINVYREKNNNAYLSSLTADSYTLDPTFDKETLEYSFEVNEGTTTININATPEVSTTTYKLLDNNTIRVGENIKRVMTIAEDGTSLIYKLTITRQPSTDNTLQSLVVYDNNNTYEIAPEFDPDVIEYELTVENEISNVNVLGTKNNALATVSGNGKYNLQVGENTIRIVVKSENKDEKTYTVNITRKPNSNPYLAAINTNFGVIVPDISHENLDYTINVDANVKLFTIQGIPEVSTTRVTGNTSYTLSTGINEYTLVTLAEDNVTTLTYNIKVIRAESNNAYLSNLIMKEGALTPRFDRNVEEYTTYIPYNVEEGTFIVTLEDDRSTYEIIGNENFQFGENEVIIRVTAEDQVTTKDYKVVITKYEKSDYLFSLNVNPGELTPTFNKEVGYYEVEVPYNIDRISVDGTLEDLNGEVTGLGTYSLNVGQNVIVVTVKSVDGTLRDYQIVVNRLKNNEARLSNVVVDGLSLFDKDIYEYNLNTTSSSLNFTTITTLDNNATYEIIDNYFTTLGEHMVKIKVTAQNNVDYKEYTFNVTKLPSNNNNLLSLSVEGYTISPTFNPSKTVYYLTVSNDINSVNIIAKAVDEFATITGDGVQNLEVGQNDFVVEVTSESGNIKAYSIIITKLGSSNNNLNKLDVLNGTITPNYSNEELNYNVVIPYEEDQLDLDIELEDDNASYSIIGNSNLKVGNNLVQVLVTSESGQIRTIKLNVERKDIVSALLKNLKIKNYKLNPEFNSYVTNYNLTIDNEITTLVFDLVETLDNEATYEIIGNSDLQVGNNVIEIIVTSSNGVDTETYTLNVNKQAYSNSFLDYLYTSEGDLTPIFNKSIMEYSIDVDENVETIELIGEAVDKSTTIVGLGEKQIQKGENRFAITLTTISGIKRTYYVTVNRAKGNNNYLSNLSARVGNTPYELSPSFDRIVTEYTINVPFGTEKITLFGTLESNTATVTGLGEKQLHMGNNVINVIVTSENGTTRTYQVTVVRPASDNNQLIELIPSSGTLVPEFMYDSNNNLENRTYTLNLDSSVSFLSFEAIAEDANATVDGMQSMIAPDGLSQRTITVTAEDGTTREYIININKERTDNAKLESLSVSGYVFDEVFDPDTNEYHMTVPNDKKVLTQSEVSAIPQDRNATVSKTNSINISTTKENNYLIQVTAPDGFTKETYKIVIERQKSNVASLASLKVNVGYLMNAFIPTTIDYTWLIPKNAVLNESSVSATASDINASIVKTPYLTYVNGEDNIYEVQVIAEDGSTSTTYRLHLELDLSADATLSSLEIDKGYYEPTFDPETKEYDVYEYVDEEEINVLGTPSQETSTVLEGNGSVELTSDVNVHYIKVQAEDETTEETYTLNIHRSILRDETLSDLGVSNLPNDYCINDKCILSPVFNEDVVSYKIKVPYEYTNLELFYRTKNEQQKVKIKVGDNYIENGAYQLQQGKTKVMVEVYDGMNKLTKVYELEVERCKSNNNYLSSLTIKKNNGENYELDPEFDKTKQEYTIFVDKDTTDLSLSDFTAIPEFNESRVYISGYTYLDYGNNDCEITVIASDGSERVYIVHIFRESEYNSRLRNITVSTGVFYNLSPQFKSTTYEYSVIVPGNQIRATIEAVAMDTETEVYDAKKEIELVTGNNIVTIRTNNHGQGSTYTVNIIKQPNTDVDLISLVVEEGNLNPTFERSTTRYSVNVGEDVDKLTIHATPSSNEAQVTITGNERLKSGKNTVNIIVQNKDKTMSKTYQLTVNKALSSNNRLREIKVYDGDKEYSLDPEFDENMHYYRVVVNDDIEKVTVDAKVSNELATVTGIGEEYLEYGDNIKEITVTAENGNVDTYRVNIHRNYNLNLKELTSDVGELDPEFDSSKTEYTIEVEKDVEEITIAAASESNKVRVEGNGTYNLNPGENEIQITVIAPDGSSKIYTVIVNKKLDDNNYIKDLQLEGIISPTFTKTEEEYEVNVRKNVKELIFNKIELESEKATYEVIGNSNFSQNNNPNEVIIKVTSESEKEREYKLKVYLREDEYFSNRLLSLTIDQGQLTPDFNPDINNYATTVANSIDKLTITTIKENEHSIVKIKNILGGTRTIGLNLGRNEIPIVVTSQDERENVYSLIVYRSESQDATLKTLTVENQNYFPIFNKDTMEYSLEVGSEVKNLNVVAVPSDPNSTIKISGNTNLVSGINVIKIKVTAPDNITEKEYKIIVNKSVSRNNYLSSLEVLDYELDKQFIKTNQGPYEINVETNVSSIMVKALPEVETTTIIGDGKVTLQKGRNVINVEATSESGDKRTYTIIVNRAYNNDATLRNILLSDGELEPIFNSSTHTYEVEVDESVEEITITGILSDNNATIQGNDTYDLTENEETNINLVVTAEDQTTKETYKIKVIRHINASSYLSKLVVKNGELYPNFHKLITAYTILVPNEVRSLEMVYEPEDELASVEISGNQSFKVGTNKVYIDVRAKDNSSTTRYEISVVRQSKASNYLKTLDISGYQLQPTFNKETMYYEVNVPENVDTVNVFAEAEDTTAMIDSTDLGIKSIAPGENRFYITVESQSGAIRTYQVVVNRSKSTENKLLTLTSDIGTWNQEFDSEVNSYTITVPEKTSKITLDGTASANSSINGLGTSDVNVGSQTRTIIVTSQSGEINTYTITIVRPSSNNVNLISLTPSTGELSPSFDNSINDYEIEVSDSTNLISFEVIPVDEDVTITGNDITILDYGENNITIKVTSEDKTTSKDIHIKVTRVKDLISIIPSESEVLLEKNETKEITYTLNPLDATYSGVEWKSQDETVAIVENGVITGKKYGSTNVRIVSKHDENIYATITVNVVNKLITSSVYEVYHFEEDDEENENYVIGFEPKTKISDIINDFDNNENTLHFYDKEDNEMLAQEEIITTGTKIKLIINDKEYDSVTIVVRGDINMDGIINVNDNKKLNNFILKTINFNYIERKAADLNKDNIINVTDYKKLNNYILKTISTVN